MTVKEIFDRFIEGADVGTTIGIATINNGLIFPIIELDYKEIGNVCDKIKSRIEDGDILKDGSHLLLMRTGDCSARVESEERFSVTAFENSETHILRAPSWSCDINSPDKGPVDAFFDMAKSENFYILAFILKNVEYRFVVRFNTGEVRHVLSGPPEST